MAYWSGRISPVFDVAEQLLIVELNELAETRRERHRIEVRDPQGIVGELKEWGVEVLVCDGISDLLKAVVSSAGIKVCSDIHGRVSSVLRNVFLHRLENDGRQSGGIRKS